MDTSSSEQTDQPLGRLVGRKAVSRFVLRIAERKDQPYVHDDHLFFVHTYFVLQRYLSGFMGRGLADGAHWFFLYSNPARLVLLLYGLQACIPL